MALRCLLFSSDKRIADPICQVLASLEVEAEYCAEAPAAVEKLTVQPAQIVIIDWDNQPEAGFLLSNARERKAAERPLTLAIVSDDASVPKALQAGANSILRKPLQINQVRETLTTARALLRAKQNPAPAALPAAAGATSPALPGSMGRSAETTLRAGEFLQSTAPAPGQQWDTENSGLQIAPEIDPLKELEPMAAAVEESAPAPAPPQLPAQGEPRGLQWYLKSRGIAPPAPAQAQAQAPAPAPAAPAKPELLGYDQTPSPAESFLEPGRTAAPAEAAADQPDTREQRAEAKLFAYITEGGDESKQEGSGSGFRLRKGPIIAAAALAACAIVAAPQAPWHGSLRGLWARGQRATHAWLNPQPVITPQAPAAHEDFARAGDEYKLPVAENIPDATTDPSQIRVLPVVDPTAKKPTTTGANADQSAGQDASAGAASDPAQTGGAPSDAAPGQTGQPLPTMPATTQPASGDASMSGAVSSTPPSVPAPTQLRPAVTTAVATSPQPLPVQPTVLKSPPPVVTPASSAPGPPIPSSLKSQMATMVPDASGNKPVEAAMPSIEPVQVPEATERALLADQPAIAYPANVKGQQGTVVLDVLIGRDGTIEDAKFLQGALAFARVAIDGVKQWKFKPYTMNGRPVAVETHLTISFVPGS